MIEIVDRRAIWTGNNNWALRQQVRRDGHNLAIALDGSVSGNPESEEQLGTFTTRFLVNFCAGELAGILPPEYRTIEQRFKGLGIVPFFLKESAGTKFLAHQHPYPEIFIVTKGCIRLKVNRVDYDLIGPATEYLINGGEVHSAEVLAPTEYFWGRKIEDLGD